MKFSKAAFLILTTGLCALSAQNAPQPSLQKELLQEYFVIAQALKQSSSEQQREFTEQVAHLIATTQDPEELHAQIIVLRKTLQQAHKLRSHRILFDATTTYYPPQMHGPFDSVWHALTYCGFFCVVYLVMIAIQDNDARKILHDKKTLVELKNRHACIKNAAASTIVISKAILSHAKRK